MDIPASLRYTASHEWLSTAPDGVVTIGITAVATDQLGDLVYVELPAVGRHVDKGESCAVVESTKAASDVYAPIAGEIVAVNDALAEQPGKVNAAPYGDGWLYRIRPAAGAGETSDLLDAAGYRAAAGV